MPYKPLQEKAYDYLKELAVSGQLDPGEVYSETKMASKIGVSRTPFREALVRLCQDKYFDIIPSKGFRLHVITEADIWDTYQVRTAIEGFCVLCLMRNRHSPDAAGTLDVLRRSLNALEEAVGDVERSIAADAEFHDALVDFAKNEQFSTLMSSYNHQIWQLGTAGAYVPHRMERTVEEHRRILDAILTGDEPAAYDAILRHMDASRDIYLQVNEGRVAPGR